MALRECFSEEFMFKVGLKGGGGGEGERHSSKWDQYEQEHGEGMANGGGGERRDQEGNRAVGDKAAGCLQPGHKGLE